MKIVNFNEKLEILEEKLANIEGVFKGFGGGPGGWGGFWRAQNGTRLVGIWKQVPRDTNEVPEQKKYTLSTNAQLAGADGTRYCFGNAAEGFPQIGVVEDEVVRLWSEHAGTQTFDIEEMGSDIHAVSVFAGKILLLQIYAESSYLMVRPNPKPEKTFLKMTQFSGAKEAAMTKNAKKIIVFGGGKVVAITFRLDGSYNVDFQLVTI